MFGEQVKLRMAGGPIYKVRIALSGPTLSPSLDYDTFTTSRPLTPEIHASDTSHMNVLSVHIRFSAFSEKSSQLDTTVRLFTQ